ncbi:MAG: DNA polymerase Y family protein [Pseudomonadota bacterium]
MRRMLSVWLPRFATDRWFRSQSLINPSLTDPILESPARPNNKTEKGDALRSKSKTSIHNETSARLSGPLGLDAPLALVSHEHGRPLLAAIDDRAASSGLSPHLPLADARALCPGLKTAPHDPAGDAAALIGLAEWCDRYSPWTAPCSTEEGTGQGPGGAGGLLLDITGCAHLFTASFTKGDRPITEPGTRAYSRDYPVAGEGELLPGEVALVEDLITHLAGIGYQARVGLADSIGAAWALARFATGPGRPWAAAAPGASRAAITPLPPAALRLSAERVELAERFGLRRIEALLALPSKSLAPRFGQQVAKRLAQALGHEGEALSPRQRPPQYQARRVFADPIATPKDIARCLDQLLAKLCKELDSCHLGARLLQLTAHRVDGQVWRWRQSTSRPSRTVAHLSRLFREPLEKIDPGFGIEVMSLAALACDPLPPAQITLPHTAQMQKTTAQNPAAQNSTESFANPVLPSATGESTAHLLDRLAARLGTERVLYPQAHESHLPERAVTFQARLSLDPKARRQKAGIHPASAAWPAPSVAARRPIRLFRAPEPVEVIALLPDHPPARFRWRRLLHRVVRAEGPERLSPEWWLTDQKAAEESARDYFTVEDQDGRRYWLFRTMEQTPPILSDELEQLAHPESPPHSGRWFMHGLFA